MKGDFTMYADKYYVITNGTTEATATNKERAGEIFEDYCCAYEFVEMLFGNQASGFQSIAQSW